MAFTKYPSLSPYKKTSQTSWYLDVNGFRNIPALDSDKRITVKPRHEHRPDLLSYDLYGTTRLWWVFAVRNPNVIKDPIYGLKRDLNIFVTDKNALFELLNG